MHFHPREADRFRDRVDAGRQLAVLLADVPSTGGGPPDDVLVLGLPRGGVPVAAEVALALGAPLDLLVVRKLGVPRQPELAMGAIGEHGVRIVDQERVREAGVNDLVLAAVEAHERAELERRANLYRGDRAPMWLRGRTALVVDDGIATGSTALAAVAVARELGARRVVVAAPVASLQAVEALTGEADDVRCLFVPARFQAVGQWYDDFSPTTDQEVVDTLARDRSEDRHRSRP
jgi:putative phosphoribosyl transferase